MTQEFLLAATHQFKKQSTLWLDTIKRDDSLTVLFFPKTDRHIRLSHLLNSPELIDHVLGNKHGYVFRPMNFETHDVEDLGDLCYQVEEHLNLSHLSDTPMRFERWISHCRVNKQTLVVVISEAEKYVNSEGKNSLKALSDLVEQYSPVIKIISFFEKDITHPDNLSFLPSKTHLYENILQYPLYDEKDSIFFIDLLTSYWQTKTLSSKIKQKIFEDCGGHFWLIKEAMRHVIDFGAWRKDEPGIQFRLRAIYDLMSRSEKEALQKTIQTSVKLDNLETLSLKYLQDMRFLGKKNQFNIGSLEQFLTDLVQEDKKLDLKNKNIVVNEVIITSFFSRKEHRILSLLLTKRGTTVTRDELASAIWPIDTQSHFSEWAIDQLIARVRKRLIQLGLSSKMIVSNRGRGYTLL